MSATAAGTPVGAGTPARPATWLRMALALAPTSSGSSCAAARGC